MAGVTKDAAYAATVASTTVSLLTQITALLKAHVVLSKEQRRAVALWIMHTYVFDLFTHTPILLITAAEEACGKTILATIVARLSKDGEIYSGETAASLLDRMAEGVGTIVLDEADTYLVDDPKFQRLFNSGYSKNAPQHAKMVQGKKGWERQKRSAWGPKGIAMIGMPDRTTSSRSIAIHMRRKRDSDGTQELEALDSRTVEETKSALQSWATSASELFPSVRVEKLAIGSRPWDIWKPLLTIATLGGPAILERASRAASALANPSGRARSAPKPALEVLSFISEMFQRSKSDVISTKRILLRLNKADYISVSEAACNSKLTGKGMANLLAPYGLQPGRMRKNGTLVSAYHRAEVEATAREWLRGQAD